MILPQMACGPLKTPRRLRAHRCSPEPLRVACRQVLNHYYSNKGNCSAHTTFNDATAKKYTYSASANTVDTIDKCTVSKDKKYGYKWTVSKDPYHIAMVRPPARPGALERAKRRSSSSATSTQSHSRARAPRAIGLSRLTPRRLTPPATCAGHVHWHRLHRQGFVCRADARFGQ